MVLNEDGRWVSGKAMKDKFVSHFNKFLGCKEDTDLSGLSDDFFPKKLDRRVAVNMIRVVSDEEIKMAMFDIDDNHAPGPDGYSSKNFKSTWSIVGPEIYIGQYSSCSGADGGVQKKRGAPKCTIKIDIQKAYDTVDWSFLNRILQGFGFHPVMVKWIMACVSSPWFMLNFNGEDHGYFEGKRGLRQGDPLSPYLFTIVMEVFNIIMGKLIEDSLNFKFHSKCLGLNISHLCFADDLLVFSYGNGNSVRIIRDALDEFKKVSRLKASIFKIPIATINEIEKMCKSFLWANGEIVKGKAKVKWLDICKPKEYGGLGIKNLRRWNDALLAKHVSNVINNKNSLWVQWVRTNYIGRRNFWDILQKKSMSWTWKRFLEIRKTVRPHVVSCVGNGRNTALWHDWWHPIGILCTIIPRRDWVSNGLSDSSLVCDVLDFDTYSWPVEWVNKFPGLIEAPMFCIDSNMNDVVGWRDKKGICRNFSCKQVWSDLNNFGDIVPWYDIVWYNNCIPRNSFILWMAVLNRLKTQDRVRGWEVAGKLLCPFCEIVPDSHNHLFFNCDYTSRFWRYFCIKVGLNLKTVEWNDLILMLSRMLNLKTGENLIIKCMIASCVSHIWRERNSRLFGSRRTSVEGVIASIENEIRLKLMGLRKRAKLINNKILGLAVVAD
ncbi:uncharacterized protein LOC128132348 [Lactuca sativa]|uniref:uncharacterized protein LOC128132348 n=1 Tax=Lactuca sativa TaxID=4236 RepID=UPI0022AE7AA1|nr:uncharacterized protein LOC128132348 [Lactuca sativa]